MAFYIPSMRSSPPSALTPARWECRSRSSSRRSLPPIGVTAGSDGTAIRIDSYTSTDLIKALVAQGMQLWMQRMGAGTPRRAGGVVVRSIGNKKRNGARCQAPFFLFRSPDESAGSQLTRARGLPLKWQAQWPDRARGSSWMRIRQTPPAAPSGSSPSPRSREPPAPPAARCTLDHPRDSDRM